MADDDNEVQTPEYFHNLWVHAGVCTAKGPRETNEDQHILLCDWCPAPGWPAGLFAVFDGHGGPAVALLASKLLPKILKSSLLAEEDGVARWRHPKLRRAAVEQAFLELDAQLGRKAVAHGSGSTCIGALVWPEEEGACRVLLANVGDSRGLIVCGPAAGTGQVEPGGLVHETRDHKPDLSQEEERIRAAGGRVSREGAYGPPRIDGDLALSRAVGDFRLKANDSLPPEKQKVSPMPDTREFSCCVSDIIVLACDGAFDVLSSERVAQLVHDSLTNTEDGNPAAAAQTIVLEALQEGTMDNVTCLVIQCKQSSTVSSSEGPPDDQSVQLSS